MSVSWWRTVEPTSWPLTVADAKLHARITHDQEDDLVHAYIKVATGEAETYLGRGLLTQTYAMTANDWADEFYLPMAAPLQSVTSVQYYNAAGTLTTLSSSVYTVDTSERPGSVSLAPTQVWPTLQADRESWRIKITYVVGWTSAALVPEQIKHGLRLYVAALAGNRDGIEADLASAQKAARACWSDRVFWSPPEYEA